MRSLVPELVHTYRLGQEVGCILQRPLQCTTSAGSGMANWRIKPKKPFRMRNHAGPLSRLIRIGLAVLLGSALLPRIGSVVADAVDFYPGSGEKQGTTAGGSENMLERRESIRENMEPLTHVPTPWTTLASTPSNAEGPGFRLALPPPVSPAPPTVASLSPAPPTTPLTPLAQVPITVFTLSPTSRTSDPVPTIFTPTSLLLRGLQEETGQSTSTPSSDGSYGPSQVPTVSPFGMDISFDDESSSEMPMSFHTMVPSAMPTSSPSEIIPTTVFTTSSSSTMMPTDHLSISPEPTSTISPQLTPTISPEPTTMPSGDGGTYFDGHEMATSTAITMLVLAVAGIIVVSSGNTIKVAEGGDGQGSFSAGSRTLTTPSVIVPGVTTGDCDREERASTRRPSMTLAVVLLMQLQLLATLSLVEDVHEGHFMWEFVESLRIMNFWWPFDGDDTGTFYPPFKENTVLVSGILLGMCLLHLTILSGVEASWLTRQHAQKIMAVTNCYDRSLSTSRMAASFRKPRFTRRTSPQMESEGSDEPRYSGSKRLTSITEDNSSDEEKGAQYVSTTPSASELGPVETCREKWNSEWLFFPHVELEFLLIAFHGSVASQACAIQNSIPKTKVYAVIVLVIYPVIVVASVCRAINVRVRSNTLLIFNACSVDDDGRSAPIGHNGFLSKLKNSWSEKDSLFSWADKGRWETVDVQDPQTRRDGDRFRIGFEPIFVDYTKSGVWFVGFFLVQSAATACVGGLLIGHSVWQLSLFCCLQVSVLVVLLWLKPFLNSVVNAVVTCLVAINVFTFVLLAISTGITDNDVMFDIVFAAQFLGLFGLIILIYLDVVKVVWGTIRKIRQDERKTEVTTGRQLENKKRIREFTRCHWFGTWWAMIRLNIVAFAQDTIEGMRRPDPVSNTGMGPDDTRELRGPNGNTLDPPKVVNMGPGRRTPPPEAPHFPKDTNQEDRHSEAGSSGTSSTSPNTRAGGEDVPRKNGTADPDELIRNASFNDHNATNEQPSGKELIKQGVERSDRTIEGERPKLDAIQSKAPSQDPTDVSVQSEDSTKDAISLSNYSATRDGASGKELIQQGPNKSDRNELVPRDMSSHLVKPGLSPQLEDPVEERLPLWSPVPVGIYDKTVFYPNPGEYPSDRSLFVSTSSSSGTVSSLADNKGPSGRQIVFRLSAGNNLVDKARHGPRNTPIAKTAPEEGDSQRTISSGSICMDSAAGSKPSSSHSQGDGSADGRGKQGNEERRGGPIGCIPQYPEVGPDGRAGRGMIWSLHSTQQHPIPDPIPRRRSSTFLADMSREGSGIAHGAGGMDVRDEGSKRLKMEFPSRRMTPFPIDYPIRRLSGNGSGKLSVSSSGRSYGGTSETEDDPGRAKNHLPRSYGQRNIPKLRNKPIEELFPRRHVIEDFSEGDGGDSRQEDEAGWSKKRRFEQTGILGSSGRKQAPKNESKAKSGFENFPTGGLNNGLMPKRAVASDHPCRRRPSNTYHPVEGRIVSEHERDASGKIDIRAEGSEPLKKNGSAQPGSAVMENMLSESGSGTEKEGKIASW